MTHAAFVFPLSAILVMTAVPARTVQAQNWPQFRGAQAGVAPDDPRLPDTWSDDRERRLENRHSRPQLELAGRVGRSRLRRHGGQRQAARSSR